MGGEIEMAYTSTSTRSPIKSVEARKSSRHPHHPAEIWLYAEDMNTCIALSIEEAEMLLARLPEVIAEAKMLSAQKVA
jgi:hypothetical protein